jgi:hypothetical protein
VPDQRWVKCPECGGAARLEPGGVRCIQAGHLLTFRRILPKTTTSSDWRGRLRQWAVDQAFMYPARGGQIPIRLLERLEEGVERRAVSTD